MQQADPLGLVREFFPDHCEQTLALYRDFIAGDQTMRFRSWLQVVWWVAAGGAIDRFAANTLRKAAETVRVPAPLPGQPEKDVHAETLQKVQDSSIALLQRDVISRALRRAENDQAQTMHEKLDAQWLAALERDSRGCVKDLPLLRSRPIGE